MHLGQDSIDTSIESEVASRSVGSPPRSQPTSYPISLDFIESETHMTQRFDPFFRSRKHLLIKISIIVILASEFFKKEGLRFETVLQGKRGLLGVQLTPTLILADSTGTVYGSWIGKFSPRENRRLDNVETMR